MKINTNPAASSRFSLLILSLTLATATHAATLNWNVASGDYATAGNWNPAQVPTSVDFARINNSGSATISDGLTYAVSNLWVGAKNINNATGVLQITSGTLSVSGAGTGANRPQVGVGTNAFGRIDVSGGGIFDRPNVNFMYIGGNSGRGFLSVAGGGSAFIDALRIGSDNDNVTTAGIGTVDISGGLLVVTNQLTIGRDREMGVLNVTGGQFINHAVNFWNGSANDDIVTVAGGNNSTGLVTIAAGGTFRAEGGIRIGQAGVVGEIADGTVQVNGGKLVAYRLFQGNATGTSIPRVEVDGGIIEAITPTNINGFIYGNVTFRVKAGGVTFDSTGFDLIVEPGVLADSGSPGGGITKSNAGTLKLMSTNTYTGPTVIEGGGLFTTTASSGGGSVTANDGSGFGTAVSYAGSSLNLSSLTLNAGTGTNDLNFALGLGNPSAPVMVVGTLTVNRTNIVNITGAGLSIGEFTLIQYTTAPGLSVDQFQIGVLPPGVSASVVLGPNVVKLNVTDAPSLHWSGLVNADWDTLTTNWLDFSTVVPTPSLYSDGQAVLFDDLASTNYVNLVQPLLPASVTVSNNLLTYTFAGAGSITGGTGLRKLGTGTLILANATNDYAGNTLISTGTLQLGNNDMIPQGNTKGHVVLNGTLDLNGFTDGINGLTGNGVIENTSGNVANLTVGNDAAFGNFSGTVTNTGGPLTLTKTGNNILVLSGTNSHTGGTTINNGFIQAANDYVIGYGTLSFGGTATGLGFSSDGPNARTVTNAVTIGNACTLGNAVNNGFLTFTAPVDFAGARRNVTISSPVLMSGGTGNGGMDKLGTATLTLQGGHNWNQECDIRNGTIILDNAAFTNTAGFRPSSDQANGTARLRIGPGSFYVLDATGVNLRIGATGGNVTATNIMDVSGTAMFPTANFGSGRMVFGQGTTIAICNLMANGLVIINAVSTANTPGYCELNLDGGTLQAKTNNPVFMAGLSNAFVRAGGVIIDSAGSDIGISQSLLDGGGNGGLTKNGGGSLFLNGINTYTGPTVANAGGLGGTGTIAGPVTITSGAALVPGASVGTLTVNNTLTLQGTTIMELSRDSGTPASDLVIATTLNRGGSLVISNSGLTTLQDGDTFDLFDWTIVGGSFTSVTLPQLWPGQSWNTNDLAVNGTIRVIGSADPEVSFAPAVVSGGNLTITGSGGLAGAFYYVLTSGDIALPATNWTPLVTNMFDGSGNFSFSDPIDPNLPARFYLLQIP